MLETLPKFQAAEGTIRAVVDVGSNSILLVIAEKTTSGWKVLYEESNVTGLGKGTKNSGILNLEPITKSLAVLAHYKSKASSYHVDRLESFGTMALRIASNANTFLELAQAQNTPVAIISGDLEAELGLDSIAFDSSLNLGDRFSIVDPGGHSTEIVTSQVHLDQPAGAVFANPILETVQRMSVPIGALGLREGILANPSPSVSDRFIASNLLDDMLEERSVQKSDGPVVVLGATGTNLVSIREKLTSWQPEKVHGAYLDYEEISRTISWMCDMDDFERSQIVGIEPGREHTIHIGLLILERFLYALKAEGCFVSVRGWRNAVLDRKST